MITDVELNPSPLNKPELDPEDQFLVSDSYATAPGQLTNGPLSGVASTSSPGPGAAHVPWLRKTEYISREGIHRTQVPQDTYVSSHTRSQRHRISLLTRTSENLSSTTLPSTSRGQLKYAISKPHSRPPMNPSTSPRSSTQVNPASQPSSHTTSFRIQRYGLMPMIYSSSPNAQGSDPLT